MSASLVAGIANFGIQFNYSSISLAILLIEQIYGDPPGWASPAMTSTVFAGSIVGMLGMGFLGDLVGRKQAMAITLSVAAAGSLLSAFGVFGAENVTYGLIAFWRFVLGIGVGGIYPLSSVFAYESHDPKSNPITTDDKGPSVSDDENIEMKGSVRSASALFWQIPGQIGVYLFGMLLLVTGLPYRVQWRLMLSGGAIPFFVALALLKYLKLDEHENKSDESKKFDAWTVLQTLYVACQEEQTLSSLFGASFSWFLFDVYLYGLMIYSPMILDMIFSENSIFSNCWENIVSIVVSLPAALLSLYCLEHYAVRNLQLIGFVVAFLSFVVFGSLWNALTSHPSYLFALFCYIKLAMALFVPSTTFVLPNTLFPENIRASCSGVAAASGKLGAFLGAFAFPVIYDALGMSVEMMCCAVVALAGLAVTYQFIPRKAATTAADLRALEYGTDESDEGLKEREALLKL